MLRIILAFLLSLSASHAQRYIRTVPVKTNAYVPKASDFRIIRGKLYNTVLSSNFTAFNRPGSTIRTPDAVVSFGVDVVNVLPEGVVMQHTVYGPNPGKRGGSLFIVRNFPKPETHTTGKPIYNEFRAMLDGTFDFQTIHGTIQIQSYDYGLENTHENRALLNTVTTNAPAKSLKRPPRG